MKLPAFKPNLTYKLLGFLLSISVLPLLIYQAASYSATRKAVLQEAKQHSMLLLGDQRDYLELQMAQIEGLAISLSSVDEINQELSKNEREGLQTTYDMLATKARIGYVLSGYSSLRGLVSIDIFTLNGTQYHVGDSLYVGQVRADLRDRLMEASISAGGKLVWHGVEDNINEASGNRKVVVASKAIYRSHSHEPAGVLLVNFSTDYLHEYFSRIKWGEGAYLMIVDAQKRLLFHPSKQFIGQTVESSLGSLLNGDSGSLSVRLDGREVLLSYMRIPDKHWYILSVSPRDVLLAPMRGIERMGLLLLGINFLLIAWFIRVYLLKVVLPLRAISDGFRRFQDNQLEAQWRLPTQNSYPEIVKLGDWFNSFLETMEANRAAQVSLNIAATAFESQEGMLVTDPETVILRVNHAFTEITGYPAGEAVGNKVRMLKSGRHSEDFYAAMWQTINRTGSWQGELWNRRKNGELYPEWLTITAVKNDSGEVTHYVGTMIDITERIQAEEEVKKLAFYDTLTHLPNRRLLLDRLETVMLSSKRSGRHGALMFMDLDNFKQINDIYGHEVGDKLLVEAAGRITGCLRETDTVARFGGDEFVVILSELDYEKQSSVRQANAVAEKIRISLAEPYRLKHREEDGTENIVEHHCTSSIGAVMFHGHEISIEDLLRWADTAMYQVKEAGRNAIRFYEKPD